MLLFALLNEPAFGSVHISIRRWMLLSTRRTFYWAKHCSCTSVGPQSSGRDIEKPSN